MVRVYLCALLLVIFGPGAAFGQSSPWPPIQTPTAVPMGVNIEGLADYMVAPMFVDAMKTSRAFGQADQPWANSGSMKVDALGNPLEDAGAVVLTQQPNMGGVYHFSCTGRTVLTTPSCDAHVEDNNYDPATNKTTAKVIVPQGSTELMLGFTQTSGGISNIRLIRPGYPANTDQIFTNEFLAAIKPFSVLRLMEYANTNANPTVHWSDRTVPEAAQFTLGKGGPWEYAIALANVSHKDIWVNVPEEADDDYIRQMALLFKKGLDPERVVYLENSNEVWNWAFAQSHANQSAAEAEVAANPNSTLKALTTVQWDDPNNKYYWGTKRVAERLMRISRIWQSVYGQAALNTQIRPVLASQIGYLFLLKLQIGYIAKVYGPPSHFIYAVAGAPYFNLDDATLKSPTDTVDTVLTALDKSIDTLKSTMEPDMIAIAKQYGVKAFTYEAGPDIGQTDQSVDAKVAANRDPRMKDLEIKFIRGWYADGGDMMMYYNLSSPYNKWGCWGLMDDITKPTPKTEAVAEILNGTK